MQSLSVRGNLQVDLAAVRSFVASGESRLTGQNQHFVQGCTETGENDIKNTHRRGRRKELSYREQHGTHKDGLSVPTAENGNPFQTE